MKRVQLLLLTSLVKLLVSVVVGFLNPFTLKVYRVATRFLTYYRMGEKLPKSQSFVYIRNPIIAEGYKENRSTVCYFYTIFCKSYLRQINIFRSFYLLALNLSLVSPIRPVFLNKVISRCKFNVA